MCELPARSIPGSEMLLVLKTRMRGSYAWPLRAVWRRHRHFIFFDEEAHVAGLLEHAEVLVAHLLGPRGEVLGRAGVGGLDLHDAAHRDAGDALLGGEDGTGARGAARVHDLLRLDRVELFRCHADHLLVAVERSCVGAHVRPRHACERDSHPAPRSGSARGPNRLCLLVQADPNIPPWVCATAADVPRSAAHRSPSGPRNAEGAGGPSAARPSRHPSEEWYYTSSMYACSLPSPGRGPSLMMRV